MTDEARELLDILSELSECLEKCGKPKEESEEVLPDVITIDTGKFMERFGEELGHFIYEANIDGVTLLAIPLIVAKAMLKSKV